jgi:hypothetical protein
VHAFSKVHLGALVSTGRDESPIRLLAFLSGASCGTVLASSMPATMRGWLLCDMRILH